LQRGVPSVRSTLILCTGMTPELANLPRPPFIQALIIVLREPAGSVLALKSVVNCGLPELLSMTSRCSRVACLKIRLLRYKQSPYSTHIPIKLRKGKKKTIRRMYIAGPNSAMALPDLVLLLRAIDF